MSKRIARYLEMSRDVLIYIKRCLKLSRDVTRCQVYDVTQHKIANKRYSHRHGVCAPSNFFLVKHTHTSTEIQDMQAVGGIYNILIAYHNKEVSISVSWCLDSRSI